MKVLLAGGSGAIGLPLVNQLRSAGHEVTAIHLRSDGGPRLAAAGASPLRQDVLDRSALLSATEGQYFDSVIAELSALKKAPLTHRRLALTDRLRIEGTANLLAVAQACGARRFVTQSMIYGYGYRDFGARILTEADPFAPQERGGFEAHMKAMRSNEDQVLGAKEVEGIALRYGMFYGPGSAGDMLVRLLRHRRLPVPRGAGVRSLIYIEDAAALTVAALERGRASTAYNAVDDEPVALGDFFRATAAAIGAPKPVVVPAWTLLMAPYARGAMLGDLRVSNARAREELGWVPIAPTYRRGVELMAEHYARLRS